MTRYLVVMSLPEILDRVYQAGGRFELSDDELILCGIEADERLKVSINHHSERLAGYVSALGGAWPKIGGNAEDG